MYITTSLVILLTSVTFITVGMGSVAAVFGCGFGVTPVAVIGAGIGSGPGVDVMEAVGLGVMRLASVGLGMVGVGVAGLGVLGAVGLGTKGGEMAGEVGWVFGGATLPSFGRGVSVCWAAAPLAAPGGACMYLIS